MSFFVWFLYAFRAVEKIVSKFVEEVEVDGTWNIMLDVDGLGLDAPRSIRSRRYCFETGRPPSTYHFLSCELLEKANRYCKSLCPPITILHLIVSCYNPYAEVASWKYNFCLGLI